ncbi:MAG: hypothetical protein ACPHDJ_04625, partial [Candidatus Puniceispirillaceae bacterium]
LPQLKNEIVELYQIDEGYFDARQGIGMRTGLAFIFLGFFIVSTSVMAAHEGLISRDWLDAIFLHIPDYAIVSSYLTAMLAPS